MDDDRAFFLRRVLAASLAFALVACGGMTSSSDPSKGASNDQASADAGICTTSTFVIDSSPTMSEAALCSAEESGGFTSRSYEYDDGPFLEIDLGDAACAALCGADGCEPIVQNFAFQGGSGGCPLSQALGAQQVDCVHSVTTTGPCAEDGGS